MRVAPAWPPMARARAAAAVPSAGHAVHIERLVVEGVALTPAQGRQLQAAIERELARLLTASAVLRRQRNLSAAGLGGGAVNANGADPQVLGRAIAATLARALESGP